jgi:hypothetical protein
MKYLIAISALLLVACSDTYRYKCQDPVNHSSSQCQPPVCEASGTCTKYLLKDQNEN